MAEGTHTETPSVSVVIPAFRAGAFLAEAVSSVESQTVPPIEIIVVDDCSPDDTVAIARTLPVDLIECRQNGGAAAARNLGIERARGEWVAFLDADDRWHPRHLELSLDAVRQEGAILSSSQARILHRFVDLPETVPVQTRVGPALMAHVLGPNPVAQTACMVRRDKLLAVGGYRHGERYSEDYELWLRLATEGPYAQIDAVTCLYRVHDGQTSRARVPMYANAWEHRLGAARRWLREANGGPAFERAVQQALDKALAMDLTVVWYEVDRESLEFFRDLVSRSPELEACWRRELKARDPWLVARLRSVARKLRPVRS